MPGFNNHAGRDAENVNPLDGNLPRINLSERVQFEKLVATGGCQGGQCPTIYQRAGDSENLYIQGYNVEADQLRALDVPRGEGIIRIPKSLVKELLKEDI